MDNQITSEFTKKIAQSAEELILNNNYSELKTLTNSLLIDNPIFESHISEAEFYYILGNCYQELYRPEDSEWFSGDLSKSVISFRKALYGINKLKFPTEKELVLKSCIETNLANNLNRQGRLFCCISLWDNAIEQHNHIAVIRKALNEIKLSTITHDPYHYFIAYELIIKSLEYELYLKETEKRTYLILTRFKKWFETQYSDEEFNYFNTYKRNFKNSKQEQYLRWCGANKLFLNDLNDVSTSEFTYEDTMTLPSFTYNINNTLAMHETLMYHGNYDELKNDYCYARYLTFLSKDIPNDKTHFFNETYPHIEDMSHSITNIKANHYKSAFKTLYSLFDKIAYFLHRFFYLNDIKYDYKISFDNIFKNISDKKNWVPHPKFKNSKNIFIHALFYILKDIRDIRGFPSISSWLEPDTKKISDIRNAIEHRSLKIVDDFGYTLTQSEKPRNQDWLKKYYEEKTSIALNIEKFGQKINQARKIGDNISLSKFEKRTHTLQERLQHLNTLIDEQKRLSTHSILITESEFVSKLFVLMKLCRNSIMYLSLAIQFEEKEKSHTGFVMQTEVPLKE